MSEEIEGAQNWKGMDGATAWHLIDRHANNWADVGEMMGAWLSANIAAWVEREVPRIDPDGPYPIDEDNHCCEWTLHQERERIHAALRVAPNR